jgi:hypothetical protein
MDASLRDVDAVFVVNQDTDVARIRRTALTEGFHHLLVLTTHRPFRNELLDIQRAASKVEIRGFSEWLSDQDMQACDDRATSELQRLQGHPRTLRTYFHRFMERSLHHKNETVASRLLSEWRPKKLYFQENLGVDGAVWRRRGGFPLAPMAHGTSLHHNITGTFAGLSVLFRRSHPITLVSDGTTCHVFFTRVNRLSFSNRVRVHSIPFRPIEWLQFQISGKGRAFVTRRFFRRIPASLGTPSLATTIHEYSYKLGEMPFPLHVFVDGFHPSNYPRSYVDHFTNHCVFMVNHLFNARWFEKHGRETHGSLPFLQPPLMAPVTSHPSRPLKVVLLALNHAGEWTSLINRSDTDLLIEAFSDLAEQFPHLHFVIRPHPTMATPRHEGIHSLERIKRYIGWRGMPNLSVSERALSEDMQRGDLFVSEYSQVLIDALQNGKPGIIVNLTRRRSFMEDYENLGFLGVRTADDLRKRMAEICRDPRPAMEIQNQAAIRYNTLLKERGYC